jgi:hypothetical protein
MSLEQELARNTEAMIALTAALSNTFPVVKTPKAKVTPAEIEALKEVEVPKPPVVDTLPATPVTSATPSSVPAATVVFPAATASKIEYAEVAAAIVATFKVDRVKTVAALAKFGAAKGPQLKAEDYVAFLQELAA